MPQWQLDQLPDLRQLALAAPDVVVANLVKALIVVALENMKQTKAKTIKKEKTNIAKTGERGLRLVVVTLETKIKTKNRQYVKVANTDQRAGGDKKAFRLSSSTRWQKKKSRQNGRGQRGGKRGLRNTAKRESGGSRYRAGYT